MFGILHYQFYYNFQIHADTLSQCYRQQLSEQEKQYSKELVDLKLRLDSVLTSADSIQIPPNLPREEAEGSESTGKDCIFCVM